MTINRRIGSPKIANCRRRRTYAISIKIQVSIQRLYLGRPEFGRSGEGAASEESVQKAGKSPATRTLEHCANGKYKTLHAELITSLGRAIIGNFCRKGRESSFLIKLIDAQNNLSVQVHPDDAYAMQMKTEKYGKNEDVLIKC